MDELELLKQDWKRQEKSLPHVESNEIEHMMHKKSTTIVKWIFIISICEFLFWLGIESLSFFENSLELIEDLGMGTFYRVSLVVNYIMIFVFIVLFFRNYRKISTEDSIKKLLKNIMITRKTVKAYVWFNIIFFSTSFLITSYMTVDKMASGEPLQVKLIAIVFIIVALVVILLLIILFYRLLYGILTRRLAKNYKILKKIEEND
jgi:TRAP-type C4-dicarboxylate transport system permease small subunit